ncbi:MAG: hypothetical protein AB7H96_17025 [Vicinamibacterales bacterium]
METTRFIRELASRTERQVPVTEGDFVGVAKRAQRQLVMAAAESRWDQLDELGRELSRLGEAVARMSVPGNWHLLYELLGDTASDIARHGAPREQSLLTLAEHPMRDVLESLVEWRPASDLRREFQIPNQSNLARSLKPFIAAGYLQLREGPRNSRLYKLTPRGRTTLGIAADRQVHAAAAAAPAPVLSPAHGPATFDRRRPPAPPASAAAATVIPPVRMRRSPREVVPDSADDTVGATPDR